MEYSLRMTALQEGRARRPAHTFLLIHNLKSGRKPSRRRGRPVVESRFPKRRKPEEDLSHRRNRAFIVKKNGGVWLHNDVVVRLQVDDNPEPIKELQRLVERGGSATQSLARSKALTFQQVAFRRVAYLTGNRRINLDSLLPLGVNQARRFYNKANFFMLFKVFNRRERFENTSFVNRFNCDVHEFSSMPHSITDKTTGESK